MSGYLRAKKSLLRAICTATELPSALTGVKELLLQYMHPPVDRVPSRFGHEKPASTVSFCILQGKRSAKKSEKVRYGGRIGLETC